MRWTTEQIQKLKDEWEKKTSVILIAKSMGVSRNAIIGKASRLNLTPRGVPFRKVKTVAAPKKSGTPKGARGRFMPGMGDKDRDILKNIMREEMKLAVKTADRRPAVNPRTMVTVKADECRWPYGDPKQVDFHLCGGKTAHMPYCNYHHALSRQSGTGRPIKIDVD